jgi:predicted XRE-type DNA-binding protein
MSELIEYAQLYLEAGFNPLPLKPDKSPVSDEKGQVPWHSQQIDNIEKRFANVAKIGICCGKISNYVYCLDFDCHQGQNISAVFSEFISTPIYKWLHERNAISVWGTPSGGYHIWFQTEIDMGGRKVARWEDNKVMIEIRGTGQYAACYPSDGYRVVGGCSLESLTPIEESLVVSLMSYAASFDRGSAPVEVHGATSGTWPEGWSTSKPDGKFNEEDGQEALDLLLQSGWQIGQMRRDGIYPLTRPGKEIKDGISATWGKRKNMFYVFTSNADPFQENKAYNPFQILTILKYAGDWKKAKDDLRKRYGMRNIETALNEVPEEMDDFPIGVFPDEMRLVLFEYNKVMNYSVDYMALAMICIIGSVVGNKYKLRVKHGYNAPLIFWGCLVGSPGANKSHPLNGLLMPVKHLDGISRKQYQSLLAEWEALDEKEQKKNPKPTLKRIRVNDTTIEALIDIHQINQRGILHHKDELLAFFNDMTRYKASSSDRQFWLSSMNNDEWSVDRVSTGHKHVDNININIIGTIQHDPLYRVVLQSDDDGLIQRFLFTKSMENAYGLTDKDIDPQVYQLWFDMVKNLHEHCKYNTGEDTEYLHLVGEVFKEGQRIDNKLVAMMNSKEYPAIVESYLAKMRTYLHRFALLMCVFDAVSTGEGITMRIDHYERAEKIVDYFTKTFISLVGAKDELQEIRRMIGMMKSKTNKEIIVHLAQEGFKQVNIAKAIGITKQAVYKVLQSTKTEAKSKK